jgi:glycosyltransferase involved in cell wall biosynthesis
MMIAVVAAGPIPAQTANSIQVMKMAQALAALGHSVCVFAPGREPGIDWDQLARHYGLAQRFEIRWLPASRWLRRYDYALHVVNAARDWGANLLYTRLPQAATLAAKRGLATIFELHDMPSGTMGPWLLREFLAAKNARRLVVNTQNLQTHIEAAFPDASKLIVLAPNGVDLQRYANLPAAPEARKQLGLPDGFTIGYTGHLYAGRGISLLLELARKLPAINFLFVGGRPEDVNARQQQAAGLPNVRFVGFVPNSQLPLYQAACDVLTLPYSPRVAGSSGVDIAAYTNPLKMFEYLAAGRPIVANELPILREILNDQNAILLDGNINVWASMLSDLQRSESRRAALASAAKQTSAEHTWENRAARILEGLVPA